MAVGIPLLCLAQLSGADSDVEQREGASIPRVVQFVSHKLEVVDSLHEMSLLHLADASSFLNGAL